MSELPKGWVKAKLVELCTPKQWKTISTKDLLEDGYAVYGANGKIGFYDEYTHSEPTLMITCRGATCGNLHISDPFSYINGNAMALGGQPKDLISLSYLYYSLKSRGLGDAISGSAQPQITRQGLAEIKIPLSPLAEQKRIVEKLDQVLAQVDTIKARLDGIPAILKRFRQSVLAAAVSGKLTEVKSFSSAKFSSLILEMKNGLSPKPNEEGKGFPILRISSVRPMLIDFKDHRFLDCNSKIVTTYKLAEQDLLFTRYNGSIDFVGVCGLVRKINEKTYLYPDKLIRVRVNRDVVSPEFIEIYFSAYEIRKVITDFIKSTSGQKGISGKDLKSVIIKYPSLKEQTEIVRLVDQYFAFADTIEQQVQKAQQRVDKLTQSILAKAFRGELVPQDPNDDPADELLKRIAAARAESEALAKAAKKVGKKTGKR